MKGELVNMEKYYEMGICDRCKGIGTGCTEKEEDRCESCHSGKVLIDKAKGLSVEKIGEKGIYEALYGLGLNHSLTSNISFLDFVENKELISKTKNIALNLSNKDGGHNKFLEHIILWYNITAPLYFWTQFDTYRIGISKQSESTMHTILKKELTEKDFIDYDIDKYLLNKLNDLIKEGNKREVKKLLPCSFLQKREVVLNYKTLRNIIKQRANHALLEWKIVADRLVKSVEYQSFLI